MKFFAMLFRLRSWLMTLLIVIGFFAPWERMGGAHPGSAWLFLAGMLASHGVLSIGNASMAVMGVAIFLALLAALLRTWAAAHLGRGVVEGRAMQGQRIVADGPYRYVRNPLYLGTWLNVLALAILMPPGGALFAVVSVALFSFALVRGEEQHLARENAAAYSAYAKSVPRFFSVGRARVPASGERPRWGAGVIGELYFWGVAITYIAFASRYNVTVLEQGVLISLGVGVLVQSIARPGGPASAEADSLRE